ncbi:integrase arm-type DNA-binding domain-containing protein [Variovorax robiniae]|uniref:Integrase arm-type DNA-binding domain-containing protein n=1 Tax=Variovorax robiniae TaxID=1836199 RepID=A0ABU8X984_9BURK
MPEVKLKLTPSLLSAAKPDPKGSYKMSDGSVVPGLFALIQPAGTKSFVFSFTLHGKRKEVTLGRFPNGLSLAEARAKAVAMRADVERGKDPAAATKAAKAAEKAKHAPPPPESAFALFAEKWQTERLAKRADSYKAQIQSRLDRFVFPEIGHKALAAVTPRDVLAIIEPLQIATPNTAEGVRKIVQAIYDYAIAKLLVETNPARPLRGIVDVPPSEETPKLSPEELGRFWQTLDKQTGAHRTTIAAAKFLVYTMTRKNETLKAKWTEFNLEAGTWTIPKERMKKKKEHIVFLSRQAKALLEEQKVISGKLEYVFPSAFRNHCPLAEVTLNHLFKRMDIRPDFSPHGTRSTTASLLRNLRIESVDPDGVRREKRVEYDVVEMLLAHTMTGVAGRYQRQDLFEERAEALQLLADEIDRLAAAAAKPEEAKQPAAQPAAEEATT